MFITYNMNVRIMHHHEKKYWKIWVQKMDSDLDTHHVYFYLII
jgi:hypothetical protein